jgi:FK506-binding protein 2
MLHQNMMVIMIHFLLITLMILNFFASSSFNNNGSRYSTNNSYIFASAFRFQPIITYKRSLNRQSLSQSTIYTKLTLHCQVKNPKHSINNDNDSNSNENHINNNIRHDPLTHPSCCFSSTSSSNRRRMIGSSIITSIILPTILIPIESVPAKIIDATDIFADNDWSSSSSSTTTKSQNNNNNNNNQVIYQPTDEITIRVNRKLLQEQYNGILGIELKDIEFRTNLRVYVKSVQTNSYANTILHIQPNWIVVSIDNISMERTNANGVQQYLNQILKQQQGKQQSRKTNTNHNDSDDIVFVFRDPTIFQSQLESMSSSSASSVSSSSDTKNIPTVTTQIAPVGDTTQRNRDGSIKSGQVLTTSTSDQRITIQQLQSSSSSTCTRKANIDDLLEISYAGSIVETGQIFDGSAILIDNKGIPGRGNDISLFFVLGKQPIGQFPISWDIGLIGMCVGERRRLIVPPTISGYGTDGLVRRGIPPNSTLQYDITLISINGLATP